MSLPKEYVCTVVSKMCFILCANVTKCVNDTIVDFKYKIDQAIIVSNKLFSDNQWVLSLHTIPMACHMAGAA